VAAEPTPAVAPADEPLQWSVRPELGDGSSIQGKWSLDVEWTDEHGKLDALRAIACEGPEHVQSGVHSGVYRVRAYTAALGSHWERAIAVRAAASSPVKLALLPASRVEGEIVDASNVAAAEIAVHLISIPRKQVTSTASDANGSFALDGVVDGEYRVRVGDVDNPLLSPPDLVVKGGRVRVERIVLPPLHEIALRVVDFNGQPLSGAVLSGRSQEGGAFELETTVDGRARATRIPAGRYRVHASHKDFGRANKVVEVPKVGSATIEIALPPKSPR
jgi:hypothetical protein